MGNHQKLLNPFTWLTREIRTRKVLPYIPCLETHIDIGCGPEKYLLKKSPCRIRIGFDQQAGQPLSDTIPAQNNSADCITLLASIEHLDCPEAIIRECHRIIKKDGKLIITTPKAAGRWLMKIYHPGYELSEGPHQRYYNLDSMEVLLKGLFKINTYQAFMLGFNQLFICSKI
ncbi:MAG: class I SAM-dependent methyltransferase [Candidatus Omnitrophica bacterium]|nr:class I SAM-dependent methyltransferase [Candidatus Omnitrophota bacterium]